MSLDRILIKKSPQQCTSRRQLSTSAKALLSLPFAAAASPGRNFGKSKEVNESEFRFDDWDF